MTGITASISIFEIDIKLHFYDDTICTMCLVKQILLKCLLLLCRCKRVVKILQ